MVRSISLLTTELAYSLSMSISAILLTRCCPMVPQRYVFNLRKRLNYRSAEHDLILENYAKIVMTVINSRLEIPNTNYVVQGITVPNRNTIANM